MEFLIRIVIRLGFKLWPHPRLHKSDEPDSNWYLPKSYWAVLPLHHHHMGLITPHVHPFLFQALLTDTPKIIARTLTCFQTFTTFGKSVVLVGLGPTLFGDHPILSPIQLQN